MNKRIKGWISELAIAARSVPKTLEGIFEDATQTINKCNSRLELIQQIKKTKDDAEHEQLVQRLDNE